MEDDVHVFALQGEIDFHFAPVLRAMLQAKLKARCASLVLDFTEVDFIDSRGIATIIEYLRDSADYGGKFCLAALKPEVKHIIDVVRLQLVMPIYDTVAEAVAGMKKTAETSTLVSQ